MPRIMKVLISIVAVLGAVGVASANGLTAASGSSPASVVQAPAAGNAGPTTINWDESSDKHGNPLPAGLQDGVGADSLYSVMVCHGAVLRDTAEVLCRMLVDSSRGKFTAADTYYIGTGGHASFPATEWYNNGCRAILAFTDYPPADSAKLGDSLARFIQLGGGVVEGVAADCTPYQITGKWRSTFAPFTVATEIGTPGSMGTVRQPFHPVMSGVSAVTVGSFRSGNTPSSLRSPNCVSLAEYMDGGLCLAACFDSAGRRAASLGMFPLTHWQASDSGQWCRLIVNAINWVAVGPSVGVTAPNGGETWHADSIYVIQWSQTDNGVKDSLYYSTNGGSSWIGIAYLDTPPSPSRYGWLVPSMPTTRARVKVVTWDADGGRVEDVSDANFTIAPAGGIEQPAESPLPLEFALHPSVPNPSATGVQIRYALPRPARVEVRIYDVAGTLARRLVNGGQLAGYRSAYWNGFDDRGRSVAPGVYYVRFQAGGFTATQKLVVRR
jgi:hypothetical protein